MSLGLLNRRELEVDDAMAEAECEGACTKRQAEAWVQAGTSRYVDSDKSRITDPNCFAESWLSTDEVALVVAAYAERWDRPPVEMVAVLAAMRILETNNRIPRFVFWFRS